MLYRVETTADVVAAMDWLAARWGLDEFVVGGICAGAYQALHTSVVDLRVRGLFLFELLRYYPDQFQVHTRLGRLSARAQALRKRYLSPHQPHPTRLADWMAMLCERDTDLLAVFNKDGGSHQVFMRELAPTMPRIIATARLRGHLTPGGDYIFSAPWSQERLTEILDNFLDGFTSLGVHGPVEAGKFP